MNDASIKIDSYIAALPDWQQLKLRQFRILVTNADSLLEEAWKWNVPVFLHNGKIIFSMAAFKAHVKYNFILNGAMLDDPHKLFNNGLESQKARSIDLREEDSIDEAALRELITTSLDLFALS